MFAVGAAPSDPSATTSELAASSEPGLPSVLLLSTPSCSSADPASVPVSRFASASPVPRYRLLHLALRRQPFRRFRRPRSFRFPRCPPIRRSLCRPIRRLPYPLTLPWHCRLFHPIRRSQPIRRFRPCRWGSCCRRRRSSRQSNNPGC